MQNAAAQRLTPAAGGLVIFGQTLGGAVGVALSGVVVEQLSRSTVTGAEHSIPTLYIAYAAASIIAFAVVLRIPIAPLRDTIDLVEPLPG